MGKMLEVNVAGFPELSTTIGLIDVTLTEDWDLLWRGLIRSTRAPGRVGTVMAKDDYTLDAIMRDSFEQGGVNVFNTNAWARYWAEPKYEAAKKKHGGGDKVLVWAGSQDPLKDTFKKGHKEHIEAVDADGFRYGTRRRYAGRLHLGGFYQPWDKTSNTPARPLFTPTKDHGFQIAKGMQRIIVGRIQDSGMQVGSVLRGLRTGPEISGNGPGFSMSSSSGIVLTRTR